MSSFPITRKKFSSGLRTVLLPREDIQTVTFLVLIGVGSRYETPRQSGLSHFLEHMFFKGTETRPTTQEIAEAIDNVGGEFNAFTGEEYTGYYVKVAAPHLKTGADVVSDILLRPLFPPEEIERERGVIKEEIKMYTDMPMRHIQHLWQQALFGDHPLGRRIDGSAETVSAFKRRDFLQYTDTHYHTGNAVVTVAGKMDVSKTGKLLSGLLQPLAKGKETKPRPAAKKSPAQRFVREYRQNLDQTHVMVGVPGFAREDDKQYAAGLLAAVLGGGMSSRLFSSIRERRGLAYMVRTMSDGYADAGSFVTQSGVRTDKAAEAVRIIMEEYDRIMDEEVPEKEIDKVKQMVKGQMVMQLEETNSLAMFAAEQELLEKKVRTPEQIWKKIDAVTAKDIKDVARELLSAQNRAVALLSPHKSTTAFEKLL